MATGNTCSKGEADRAQAGKNMSLSLAFKVWLACCPAKDMGHTRTAQKGTEVTPPSPGAVGTQDGRTPPPDPLPHIPYPEGWVPVAIAMAIL